MLILKFNINLYFLASTDWKKKFITNRKDEKNL